MNKKQQLIEDMKLINRMKVQTQQLEKDTTYPLLKEMTTAASEIFEDSDRYSVERLNIISKEPVGFYLLCYDYDRWEIEGRPLQITITLPLAIILDNGRLNVDVFKYAFFHGIKEAAKDDL